MNDEQSAGAKADGEWLGVRREALALDMACSPDDEDLDDRLLAIRQWLERAMASGQPGGGAALIAEERARQIGAEGWSAEHDDEQHWHGELALRAAELAVIGTGEEVTTSVRDEWGLVAKHRGERVRQLTIAGALIAAEIDRLLRAEGVEVDP